MSENREFGSHGEASITAFKEGERWKWKIEVYGEDLQRITIEQDSRRGVFDSSLYAMGDARKAINAICRSQGVRT